MPTTTATRCVCGESQPHAPNTYIGPGVDGIDSTPRTCAGTEWTETEWRIDNPRGLTLEGGKVTPGSTFQVFADRGPDLVCLGSEAMDPDIARQLGQALLDAAEEVQR
jgi:hypothetical protein